MTLSKNNELLALQGDLDATIASNTQSQQECLAENEEVKSKLLQCQTE